MHRFSDFILRHRRKVLVASAVLGGTYIALKYVQRKFLKFQEKQARDFFEKARRTQHFESTERTCDNAIIRMNAELIQAIIKECSTNDLVRQLRQNPSNKVELWEEMKIVAFTRLTAFIFASSMLTVALRVQLNVLGGYIYCNISTKTTTVTKDNDNERKVKISDELKEEYLSLIKYFIHGGGLSQMLRLIRAKVNVVMKEISLDKLLCLADIEQLFWTIQMSINSDINSDPCTKMSKYLLPSKIPDYTNNSDILAKMYNETLDLLETDDAASICSNNICRGFSLVMDVLADKISNVAMQKPKLNITTSSTDDSVTFNDSGCPIIKDEDEYNKRNKLSAFYTSSTTNGDLFNINNAQIALAKIIPIINSLTSNGYDSSERQQNLATSLVTYFLMSDKCKILGANVYESFSSVLP